MRNQAPNITSDHLRRDAYLYVRQATIHQGFPGRGSLERQYAWRQQAVALGWPRVVVIDCDLGQSGASAHKRNGFQKLVADTSMGRVGIVLAIEVSRLTRNGRDWYTLLETCALSNTLMLVEHGIYDPADANDRLLLGAEHPPSHMIDQQLHHSRRLHDA